MSFLPQNYVIRTGIGHSIQKLSAFDRALISAGVGSYNLIKVSSILPAGCKQKNDITLAEGTLLPSAFATIFSDVMGETISAAVAVAIPSDRARAGVIMKYTSYDGMEATERYVRQLAENAMRDRKIVFEKIISDSVEVKITTDELYCAFATVSMW